MKFNRKLIIGLLALMTLVSCDQSSWLSNSDSLSSTGDSTSGSVPTTSSSSINTSYQSYTVTFVTNATASLEPVITYRIETMPIVSNGALTLEGWYLNSGLTDPVNFPFMVTENVTLYAKWIEANVGFVFKPTFDSQGYVVETYLGNATSIVIQSTYNGKPVLELGEYLFYNNGAIVAVTMPNGLKTIGMAAFKNASKLTSVTIPNTVTHIHTDAFSGASALTTINMSTAIIYIGNNAFENLTALTTIDLPSSIEELQSRAFGGCTSLVSVKIRALIPPLRFANSFENTPSNLRYLVPSSVVATYKAAGAWAPFSSQIVSL